MKKITILACLLLIGVGMNAQNSVKKIFNPLTPTVSSQIEFRNKDLSSGEVAIPKSWLPRIAVSASAYAVNLKGKPTESQSLTFLGFGGSYGQYTLVNEKPYCTFSVNAMVMTQINLGGTALSKWGIGGGVDAFNKLVGIGFAYIDKEPLLLLNLSFPL